MKITLPLKINGIRQMFITQDNKARLKIDNIRQKDNTGIKVNNFCQEVI
jgi:hypothetical protein